VIYLLDVSALIAAGYAEHQFHSRMAAWIERDHPGVATTAITELGFVRILSQTHIYGLSITEAQALLIRLKSSPDILRFIFIPDDQDASHLPPWVKTSKDTTDGHLAELAKTHGALLATLDKSIPGSYLINE
jgi:predicted nucleic acid-binding protein